MMVSNRGSIFGLLAWQWHRALLFSATGAAAVLLYWRWPKLHLPSMPVAVIGGAIGIFVSFRTNSSYARWWEGRQLWGRLVNFSRHIASQAIANLDEAEARALVTLQIAYVHALRCALRDQNIWADAEVVKYTSEGERELWKTDRNPCSAILHRMRERVTRVADDGKLHELRLLAFDQSLSALLDVQGGCERIKKTPFPRGYVYISERLIIAFGMLLPFALVNELGWVVIPINLLVCGAFALISEAGRVLEDPFTMFWNGLPLSALSTTIELNLRQRLGEREVPPLPAPDARGILM